MDIDNKVSDALQIEMNEAFINDVFSSVKKHKIHPDKMFCLFGLIGQTAIAAQVSEGIEHPEAMLTVVGNFMQGLGMQFVSVSDDGENKSVH
jgi:hypothetical protein